MTTTAAHSQAETHRYTIRYPAHEPRKSDPHYRDFDAYRRRTVKTARCAMAVHADLPGDPTVQRQAGKPRRLIGAGEGRAGCDVDNPLELHHGVIEFALANAVDFRLLEKDYPGVSNPDAVGAWIETAPNLIWYCREHHRGQSGVHCASSSDFTAEHYISGLIA